MALGVTPRGTHPMFMLRTLPAAQGLTEPAGDDREMSVQAQSR